jgi:amino acid transporter
MADVPQPNVTVERLERDVEERSAVFKKELGLFDLVLTQVVFVVGTIWVGHAAKLGNEQNVFWILAIITFYLPLAGAVIFLNRLMPLEGGLYQWAKFAFNDFVAHGCLESVGVRHFDSGWYRTGRHDKHLVRDRF